MSAQDPLRFGLIGVDSSHALQFTRLLGDGRTGRVAGGTVVAAWQGPTSTDFPPSRDRNDANASTLAESGIALLGSPAEVAAAVDVLLLVSSDARTRRDQYMSVVGFDLPVYVDTRFAANPEDAEAMLAHAEASGCLVLSGSPKRFTPEFRAATTTGATSAALTGPLVVQPGHPGLSWYGVHLVDLAVAALGPDCVSIEPRRADLLLTWSDGRTATIGGPAEWNPWTRGQLRTARGAASFEIEANEDMLAGLLESIMASSRSGTPNIDRAEVLAICRIVAAGNEALESGATVRIPERTA
ncbi:gfo/Idh/MocA family oxidoreductase [Microbacterium sp.]|uniref:gfo/Idh/MocA family oxidoreductase n=1 Tax=Microbacterium sp. TaxID=51671 RepID=UPI003A948FD2